MHPASIRPFVRACCRRTVRRSACSFAGSPPALEAVPPSVAVSALLVERYRHQSSSDHPYSPISASVHAVGRCASASNSSIIPASPSTRSRSMSSGPPSPRIFAWLKSDSSGRPSRTSSMLNALSFALERARCPSSSSGMMRLIGGGGSAAASCSVGKFTFSLHTSHRLGPVSASSSGQFVSSHAASRSAPTAVTLLAVQVGQQSIATPCGRSPRHSLTIVAKESRICIMAAQALSRMPYSVQHWMESS